ncbi:hypothetical protein [Microbacterium suwonense]|uniref:Tfp pilus assembly protein PilO n=1 Tax=Microbacterium suwonense TaxID=683047 RepID=A0ABN6X749_9MICO|nr:hypothetical protein [Microbacterium suwonense]BDZ40600.1 hypothetical protein GCM10025863_32140 [Microbacterium suwonense]
MTKQLINLIGGLVCAVVLVAGGFLFALPQYLQAEGTEQAAQSARQNNATQQSIIDALRVQQSDSASLEADIAALRAQIPAEPHIDDIVRLALIAAARHGGAVDSVAPGDPVPFAARTAVEGAPASKPADAEAGSSEASASPGSSTSTGSGASAASDPRQVPIEITFTPPSVQAATDIVDALRAGPRVVAIVQATTVTDDDGEVHLTVSALAFSDPS